MKSVHCGKAPFISKVALNIFKKCSQNAIQEVRDSPFILSMLKEAYSESTFENVAHKMRSKFNEKLLEISEKLELSVALKLKTARDCYVSTLKWAKVPKDDIGDMFGHANSMVTEH